LAGAWPLSRLMEAKRGPRKGGVGGVDASVCPLA